MCAVGLLVVPAASGAYSNTEDLRLAIPKTALPLYPFGFVPSARILQEFEAVRFASDGALEIYYATGKGRVGWWYNPVSAARYCLAAWNEYVKSPNLDSRQIVVTQAAGLLHRAERRDEALIWRYGFSNPPFHASAGWLSGMGQSLAAACLAGAYNLTNQTQYASGAYGAYLTLITSDGPYGTATFNGAGVIYEEVAGGGSFPSQVLNGHIFAVAGMWTTYQLLQRAEYRGAYLRGIAGLRKIIDQYLRPGMSLYDLGVKNISKLGRYNRLHIEQLKWLAHVSGDRHFYEVASRMTEFEKPFPYDVTASATRKGSTTDPLYGRSGFFWAGPDNTTVTLTVTFPKPTLIDEVRLIAPTDVLTPRGVTVMLPGSAIQFYPQTRFMRIVVPPVLTTTLRIGLRPRSDSFVGLRLLAFSNPETRSLIPMPGEIDPSYRWRGIGDGTGWQGQNARWLLFELGPAYTKVSTTLCGSEQPRWSFSPDLTRWSQPVAHADQMILPSDARYALLRWNGVGCVRRMSGS